MRSQNFADYEHIVIDAGSSDGSREWLSSNSDEQTHLVFESDAGPSDGLNKGLLRSKGDVFLYINADDELAPEALARIDKLHSDHAGVDVVIGNGWTIDSLGNPVRHIRSDRFTPFRYASSVGTVLQQATSYKRGLIDNGIRFNLDNRVNWDTEFLFDAVSAGFKSLNVTDCLGYFRLQSNSITVSGRYDELLFTKRRQLISQHAGTAQARIGLLVSPLARIGKRLRTAWWNRTQTPVFPGLSRASEDSE